MSSRPVTTYSTSGYSRSWTGQTRPTTGRPHTAASTTRREGSYVIAVLEGRGVSREVGIAALDRDTGHVMLVQVRRFRSATVYLTEGHLLADC
jgi:DNA mismatch repair protein MSH4